MPSHLAKMFTRVGARKAVFSWRGLVTLLALLAAALACRGPGGPPPDIVFTPGPLPPALVFTPDQLPAATVGQPYSATITITQNRTPVSGMTVNLADLPPGLNLEFIKGKDAAQISGTPLQAGTFKFSVTAWCFGTNTPGQTGGHDYSVVVQ